jgi:hypothetical protein
MTKHKHDQTVALTILAQLGAKAGCGTRFRVMTGVSGLLADHSALSFQLPKNQSGATKIKIRLTPRDTYEVTTYRINLRAKCADDICRVIDTQDDVYAEDLQAVFTRMTGLYTRL